MTIRPARLDEVPELSAWIEKRGGMPIDLRGDVCFVAEIEGAVVGVLPLRLVWQGEPLLVRGGKMQRSRAALMLYRHAEQWIRGVDGTKWFFAFSRSRAVWGWAGRLGWHQIYQGGKTFIKHMGA